MNKKLISMMLLPLAPGGSIALAQSPTITANSHEFTIGGSGTADDQLNDTDGGITLSYGKYTSDRWLWSLRQSLNYSNPEDGGVAWNGSTRVAGDYHFGTGRVRPLLGANVGYVYGDNVADSWAAGVEGGLKYYVNDTTFVSGMVEYAWLFNEPDELDDTFDNGRFVWTVGVGFNF